MGYFPKSKVNLLTARRGELVYADGLDSYEGPYIEISDGKRYAGTNPNRLGKELIIPLSVPFNFGNTKETQKYHLLKVGTFQFLANVANVVASKSKPTEKDYKKGFFNRYFARRNNQKVSYFEISKKTYTSIKGRKGEHNHHMFSVGKINWVIKGDSVRKSNKNILKRAHERYTDIYLLFPKLNEFEEVKILGNNTTGGELYYNDGSEYVGSYHIHPTKGPMVGPQHTEREHEVLFWKYDLQTPKEKKGMVEHEPMALEDLKPQTMPVVKHSPVIKTKFPTSPKENKYPTSPIKTPKSQSTGKTFVSNPAASSGKGGY